MASSYGALLRTELPAFGDKNDTWDVTVNTNVGTLLEQSIAGWESIATADANVTLSTANGATDQARKAMLQFTGVLTANRNVVVPTSSKLYVIDNACTGSFSLVVKTTAGSGITIGNGKKAIVYCDGTNVVDAVNYFSSLTLGSALPLASGGLASTTAAGGRSTLGFSSRGGLSVNRNASDQTGATSSAFNKIQFTTEDYDTNSWFDNATNYRYTPLESGYYQVSLGVKTVQSTSETCQAAVYKNGAVFASGNYVAGTLTAAAASFSTVSKLVYMNGSTDYIEGFCYVPNGITVIGGNINQTFMTIVKVQD